MKIYFNAFWGGFFDGTNPVDVRFFLELFKKVFDEECLVGTLENSDVLCETMFSDSVLYSKTWKTSIYFSGEARRSHDKYDLILCGERNHDNIVNCPLFVPFLWCRNGITRLENATPITEVPQQQVVAIISNPNGQVRNSLLTTLEEEGIQIIYGGSYRNNIGCKFPGEYCSPDVLSFISQFKFVISMENSYVDTYITEKICSGFLSNTIPIYWGTREVSNYFNQDRFIYMDPSNPMEAITKIKELDADPKKWLSCVNQPIFKGGSLWRTVDDIARDCKAILRPCPLFPHVKQIYFICNKRYEPERYNTLVEMTRRLSIEPHMHTFLAPTWGSEISTELYNTHVRRTLDNMLPWWNGQEKLKPNILSIILNYKAVFEDIVKRYSSSDMIITFESDIFPIESALEKLPRFLRFCYTNTWGSVHFGYGTKCKDDSGLPILASDGEFSLIRHFNTRCTDTLLWRTNTIEKILNYMNETEEYSEPFDHYLCRYFETREQNDHSWSSHVFFKQASTYLEYHPDILLCQYHYADCYTDREIPLRNAVRFSN
jgi:hypothetical protein